MKLILHTHAHTLHTSHSGRQPAVLIVCGVPWSVVDIAMALLPAELQFLETGKGRLRATVVVVLCALAYCVFYVVTLPEELKAMNHSTIDAVKHHMSAIPEARKGRHGQLNHYEIVEPTVVLRYWPSNPQQDELHHLMRRRGRFAALKAGIHLRTFICKDRMHVHGMDLNADCPDRHAVHPKLTYHRGSGPNGHEFVDNVNYEFDPSADEQGQMARFKAWLAEAPKLHADKIAMESDPRLDPRFEGMPQSFFEVEEEEYVPIEGIKEFDMEKFKKGEL